MSSFAYHDSMPSRLAIGCPICANQADFEFAEQVKLKSKNDLTWFMQSPHFECEKSKDGDGRSYHVVIYFHGLIARGLPDIPDIPEGYSIGDWARSEHKLMTRSSFCGAVICPHCGVRQKHELVWPDQAYFQISYRNHTLWAFNRQSAIELCAYINATNRDRSDYEYWPFLMKIPHVFQSKGARDTVVRRLKKCLERCS